MTEEPLTVQVDVPPSRETAVQHQEENGLAELVGACLEEGLIQECAVEPERVTIQRQKARYVMQREQAALYLSGLLIHSRSLARIRAVGERIPSDAAEVR